MINDKLTKELQEQITENKDDITNIKNGDVLSTNEIKTNEVWIDGKPIYRKVIEIGALANSGEKRVSHGLDISICKIREIIGVANASTITISSGFNDEIYINNSNVIWNTKSNRSSFTGYVILKYTKTTD